MIGGTLFLHMKNGFRSNGITLLIHLIILAIFAIVYANIGDASDWSTGKKLNWRDAIHFSITTHTTVGYGDIYPIKGTPRWVTHIQMLLVFFLAIVDIFNLDN